MTEEYNEVPEELINFLKEQIPEITKVRGPYPRIVNRHVKYVTYFLGPRAIHINYARLILSHKLGRLLTRRDALEFIDGDKYNLDPDNITLKYKDHNATGICENCNTSFSMSKYQVHMRTKGQTAFFCSQGCASIYSHQNSIVKTVEKNSYSEKSFKRIDRVKLNDRTCLVSVDIESDGYQIKRIVNWNEFQALCMNFLIKFDKPVRDLFEQGYISCYKGVEEDQTFTVIIRRDLGAPKIETYGQPLSEIKSHVLKIIELWTKLNYK